MSDNCCCCSYNSVTANTSEQTSSAVVSDEQIKENIRIIEIHRSFVYTLGKTIYPEYNFVAHDLSKFSSAELVPYTIKFVAKLPDDSNPDWKTALEHHYRNNPHHPQFWGSESMPEEYLKESIVDMIAAKYQYRKESEILPEYLTLDMLEMNPMYLTRYSETDRERVLKELERLRQIDWTKIPIHSATFRNCSN